MDIGNLLPWVSGLNDDDGGRPLDWRDTRRNRVVFFTHPAGCADCSDYARDLMELRDRLSSWDGDVWLVGETADDLATPSADNVVRVTGDADRRLRQRCGLPPDEARLVIADRWGQIWQTAVADDHHVLVDPADVLETTKWIATQCPECETLDQPIGDWSSVR